MNCLIRRACTQSALVYRNTHLKKYLGVNLNEITSKFSTMCVLLKKLNFILTGSLTRQLLLFLQVCKS